MGRLLPLLTLVALAAPQAPAPLRVKATPAVAPCVSAAAAEYQRLTGRRLAVETTPIDMPESAAGADVVVAADQELHRVIESGTSHPELDVDVARIPWVLAGAPGADTAALERASGPVLVMDGVVAREARRRLARQGRMPARVSPLREPRGPVRLAPGETALVPLSLAGPGPVTSLDVPPLTVRALGVRASTRLGDVRAFLDFLTGEPGNTAFRACGRPDAP